MTTVTPTAGALERLADEIASCEACPRLVAWRREVGAVRRAAYANDEYWARPLPGFGDPSASLLIVGLAPAAHGGNRTGRMFTGDRSGDFLFAALHRAGFANRAESRWRDDGLELSDVFISAAVRCAPPENKPTPDERAACSGFLRRELELLTKVRVILALGAFALEALFRLEEIAGTGEHRHRRPRFAHGLEVAIGDPTAERTLICSYHPSQRNVFTGLLTATSFDAVLTRAGELGGAN
ncbi:MAG: uracil-DNA glycosylase [Acidimicrobiaceae bacterium]|nr:uracil-DNA glycosylase [Acidimicrobiaceae bacterium]